MQARSGRRALALAALVVVVAGSGAAAARVHTTATVYEAFSYHGVVIPHAQVESGYCWESSAVTQRLDAWRCFVGNEILDPCFSSEFANNVVCPTPWADAAVEINLTRPLPKPTNKAAPSQRLAPWAIETTTGADCLLYSGAGPQLGRTRMNYACIGGKLGLWGYPDRRRQPWTILSAPPTATALQHRASILHVWM